MVSFAINLKVMSRVGAQHNKTLRGWHEIQRRDITLMKTKGRKTSSSCEKVGNIASTS